MATCDLCSGGRCNGRGEQLALGNCPMNDEAYFSAFPEKYRDAATQSFYLACAKVESEGYGVWPRVREIVELSQKMGYKKIGIAFCSGLHTEARATAELFRKHGLTVVSAMCKTGGIPKETLGIATEDKLMPSGFEAACNPIAQAALLNDEKTDFNVVIGLCVGHDSLFLKHSDALCTVLIAKDRVLAHNPAGAIYCRESYFKGKI